MAETVRATLRARLTRMLVVLAVVAGVVVVSLGTGYRASRALLDDGSAFLVKGRTISHANAETGRSDAEVARDLARPGERLSIHQTGDGQVLVIDTATGVVSRLDQATMTTVRAHRGTPGRIQALGSGRDSYYVDTARGTVDQADPQDATVRRRVRLPAAATAAVADPKGPLWVLDRSGTLSRVENGTVVDTVDVGSGSQQVTVVGGRPVLVDDAGQVRVVAADGTVRTLDSGLTSGGDYQVPQAGGGGTVWVVDRRAGSLVGVDLGSGATSNVDLGADPDALFGPSLTHAGKVYVPDFTAHVVRVVSADGRLERTIAVPGTSAQFDLFVDGGRVWMNDPSARSARVLDTDGDTRRVDKGPGHGVSDPGDEHVPAPPVGPVAPTVPDPATAPVPSTDRPARDGGARPDTSTGSTSTGGSRPTAAPDPTGDPTAATPTPAPTVATPEPTAPGPGGGSTPATTIAVPDTVGTSRTAACAALRAAGLDCTEAGIGSQAGVPPDQVVAESPAAGTQVAPGTIVTVQYAGAITVPDLSGRTPREACDQLLTPAGLTCDAQAAGAAASGQPVGVVTSQTPAPGQQVGGGSTVSFRYFDQFHVDNFIGLSPTAACQAMASRPITCKATDKGNGPRGSTQNVVVDQSLAPGDYPAGRSIDLGFYSGENGDAMPNVVGQPAAAACAQLATAGYNDCAVVESPTPSKTLNTALTQSEAPGTIVGRGKHIEVTQETTVPENTCRFRRPGESVWVIRVGCNTSGVEGWEVSNVGIGYTSAQPGTVQLFDNICRCGGRIQHQITRGGYNPDPAWDVKNGPVGFVFTQDFGGMAPLQRLIRNPSIDGNGGADYAYALVGTNEYANYISRNFVVEDTLGYMWP